MNYNNNYCEGYIYLETNYDDSNIFDNIIWTNYTSENNNNNSVIIDNGEIYYNFCYDDNDLNNYIFKVKGSIDDNNYDTCEINFNVIRNNISCNINELIINTNISKNYGNLECSFDEYEIYIDYSISINKSFNFIDDIYVSNNNELLYIPNIGNIKNTTLILDIMVSFNDSDNIYIIPYNIPIININDSEILLNCKENQYHHFFSCVDCKIINKSSIILFIRIILPVDLYYLDNYLLFIVICFRNIIISYSNFFCY